MGDVNTQTEKESIIDLGKLVAAREAKGLTQADLAKVLGLPRQQVWQFERGIGLTLENVHRIARFYRRPIEHFIAKAK